MKSDYQEFQEPVWHAVFENFPGLAAQQLYELTPKASWPHWVKYHNSDERKRTSRDLKLLGEHFVTAVNNLFWHCPKFARYSGIDGLVPDETLHGGGVHVSGAGDYLQCHLDYAAHPHLPGWERRLNAIYYAVPEWKEEWGGATCLYKPDGETVVSRIYPKPGRLLLFETNDLSYHGAEVVTCPPHVERVTLAVYFLAPIRVNVTRQRALFVPRRG